jgi:hypothetical protein
MQQIQFCWKSHIKYEMIRIYSHIKLNSVVKVKYKFYKIVQEFMYDFLFDFENIKLI